MNGSISAGSVGTFLRSQPASNRDGPLLTQNGRKLRHLRGITIRNLNLKPSSKNRTRSNDDESIPTSWKSPSKLLARTTEEETLVHSRSSADLSTAAHTIATSNPSALKSENETGQERPALRRMKRRSTRRDTILFGSVFENASVRNKRLEEATLGRMAESFFSLHISPTNEPFYVSEIVQQTNPSYRSFELFSKGPSVSRLDSVVIKVWARRLEEDKFVPLIELDIALRYLQYIGKNLENFRQPYPENCIILFLKDGYYTSFTDLPPSVTLHSQKRSGSSTRHDTVYTSSYDQLMKLKNLQECILDAENIQARVEAQTNALLEKHEEQLRARREVGELKERLKDLRKIVNVEKRQCDAARRQTDSRQAATNKRKEDLVVGRAAQDAAAVHLSGARPQLEQSKQAVDAIFSATVYQRKRILDELQNIYPIEHKDTGEPLNFTICKIHLPNTPFEVHNDDEIAAALGYVAHLVFLLSFYLGVFLRYPVVARGSHSYMEDHISTIQGSRIFPLWTKGTIYYRFEYAVFLLNKDIEQLLVSQNCIVLNIQHTLPNLKYLFYMVTAGASTIAIERERVSAPFQIPTNRKTTRAVSEAGSHESILSQSLPIAPSVRNRGTEALDKPVSPAGSPPSVQSSLKKVLATKRSNLWIDG